jgi:hypothetical protein
MSQRFGGRIDSVVIEFRERVMDELNVFETCGFDVAPVRSGCGRLFDLRSPMFPALSLAELAKGH